MRLNQKYIEPRAILITHSHYDHCVGLKDEFFNFKNCNIFSTSKTKFEINEKYVETKKINFKKWKIISPSNKWTKIENTNWKIKAFHVYHDVECIGYLIKNKNNKILYLTDTNYIYKKFFKKCNYFLVECNYGTDYCETQQKEKIHNEANRHMNINDVYKIYKNVVSKKMKKFILIHISNISKLDFLEKFINKINDNRITFVNPKKTQCIEIV